MAELRLEQRYTERDDAVWRRAWRIGLVASVLVHVGALFWFRQESPLPEVATAAAGPRNGDDEAAGGGGGMQALALLIEIPPPPAPIPRPPEPLPVPDAEVEVEPVTDPVPPQPTSAGQVQTGAQQGAGQGPGQGASTGPGVGNGTGLGDGGDGESGLYRLTPPTPRGLILPPSDRPGRVRGKEVVVYVFVTDRGRVVSDSTRLAPTTGDSKFDDRLRRQASEWVFNPARKGGRPIAEWFKYTIVL